VSTIIPVYSRPRLLSEAVNSVLNQTYRPIEIIIVDDGSTDDTGRMAEALAQSHPSEIRVIHQKNAGPGSAREAGRRIARGEYIQYLDSDDILLPTKFEVQIRALGENPECGVAYGMTRFYRYGDPPGDTPWKRTGETIGTMFPSLLQSRWWGTSTPLYRRDLTDRAGPWQPLRNEEDWEYDCRIASQHVTLSFCPTFVSEQRSHEGPRLSQNGSTDKNKLKDRAKAHALIFGHAKRAGLGPDVGEMKHFARELFFLARLCGGKGLVRESEILFHLSRMASSKDRGKGWDFRLYHFLCRLFGWQRPAIWASRYYAFKKEKCGIT